MHNMVNAIAAQNVSPIIRIVAPELWVVKRALDTGGRSFFQSLGSQGKPYSLSHEAHGILCPMMSTAEEARRLVSFAKFPVPKGKESHENVSGVRGVGSPFAPAAFNQNMGEYLLTANRNTFVRSDCPHLSDIHDMYRLQSRLKQLRV